MRQNLLKKSTQFFTCFFVKPVFCFSTVLIFFGLTSCATTTPPQKSNFTPAVAKSLLVKGKTTQSEILKVWGSPNISTQNSEGQTVWTYNKQSFEASSSAGVGTLFLITGSKAVSQAATASFDVIITFDSQDIVQEFSITSSQF